MIAILGKRDTWKLNPLFWYLLYASQGYCCTGLILNECPFASFGNLNSAAMVAVMVASMIAGVVPVIVAGMVA